MLTALLALTLLAGAPHDSRAPLARLAPPDAPLVLAVEDGALLLDAVLGSELERRVRAFPEWEAALRRPQTREALSVARLFGGLLERTVEEAARDVLGDELLLAVRPRAGAKPAVVLATRTASPALAARVERALHHLLTLAGDDEDFDDSGPVKTVNGDEFHAVAGDCFVIGNDRGWVAELRDRALQANGTGAPPPGSAVGPTAGRAIARLRVDLAALRPSGAAHALPEVFDNALNALLVSGLFAAANAAPRAELQVEAGRGGVTAELALALDGELPQALCWFFPAPAEGVPFTPPQGTIATLHVRRDFAAFYAARHDLLADSIQDKLVEFDNVASIFFGGRSFGDEVLPAFAGDALLVVTPQRWDDLPAPPEVRIPAFTLVAPLAAGSGLTRNDLLVAFQTTIGLVNADRAQKGHAPLMLAMDRQDGVDVQSARFLLEDEDGPPAQRFNASPALAVVRDHLVLGSARDGVEQVAGALRTGAAAPAAPHARLDVDVAALAAVLADNREALVANRMIEQGESRAEAEQFQDRLLAILALGGRLVLETDAAPATVRLRLDLRAAGDREESP